ncbi:hypothetical protein D3C76_494200 [compost metagenome]
MKKGIIVTLGMHRSGTSLLSAALECLGVDFGDNLISPRPDNPKGFWEDEAIVELNDQLYAVLGSFSSALGFDEQRLLGMPECAELQARIDQLLEQRLNDRVLFGMKDPRLPRLMNVWSQVFEAQDVESAFVIPVRNPLSVAASLARREDFPTGKSLLLWYEHMYRALHFAGARRMVVVDYDGLLEHPRETLLRMADRLGLTFDEAAYQRFLGGVLDRELRHAQFDGAALRAHESSFSALLRLHDLLCRLARDEVGPADKVREMAAVEDDFSALWSLLCHCGRQDVELWSSWQRGIREREDFAARENEMQGRRVALEEQFLAARRELEGLRGRMRCTEEELRQANDAHARALRRLDLLHASTSWKITAPLRWGKRLLAGRGIGQDI